MVPSATAHAVSELNKFFSEKAQWALLESGGPPRGARGPQLKPNFRKTVSHCTVSCSGNTLQLCCFEEHFFQRASLYYQISVQTLKLLYRIV